MVAVAATLMSILFVVAPVSAATLKIATLAPDGTTWMKEFRAAGKQIEQQTVGRVKIKYFPGGVMGNDAALLRKIRIGQLQGAALTGGGAAKFYPDANLYSLPFQFRNYAEVDYVRERMDKIIHQGMEQAGYVLLGLSEGGFAYVFSNSSINRVADLGGKKVWAPEGDKVALAAFRDAGVSPIPLPIPDVYTGLQTGLVDTVTTTPTGAIALQWHTKMTHYTDVPVSLLMGAMVISQKAFKRVSAADQAIVRLVMADAFSRMDELNRVDNDKAATAMSSLGISSVTPDLSERDRWENVAERAITDLAAEGVYSPALLKQMQQHIRDFRASAAAQ